MSPRRTTHWPAGTPCWLDVSTPDIDAAQAFYGPLLGWSFGAGDPDFGGYCMCEVDGLPAAGMVPATEGMPPAWTLYFSTDDVAASVAAVPGAGGTVLSDVMPIGDAGAMAIASDPAGAAFGLWQADQMIGTSVYAEAGGLAWEDLRSTDPDASRAFYGALLGWEFRPLDMAGPDYSTVHLGGDDAPLGGVGGMMGMDGFPSHWIVYFGVADVDAAVRFAEENGGHVLSPGFDTPFGRMAALTDPFGASFWVTSPNPDTPEPVGGE